MDLGESIHNIPREQSQSPECIFDYTKSLTDKITEAGDISNIRVKVKVLVKRCTNCTRYPIIFTLRQQDQFKLIKLPWLLGNYTYGINET